MCLHSTFSLVTVWVEEDDVKANIEDSVLSITLDCDITLDDVAIAFEAEEQKIISNVKTVINQCNYNAIINTIVFFSS